MIRTPIFLSDSYQRSNTPYAEIFRFVLIKLERPLPKWSTERRDSTII